MDTPDVTSTGPSPVAPEDTAPGAVTPDLAPSDRPVENLAAEMNRKFNRLQEQLQTVSQMIADGRQGGTPARGSAPTDDELWSLAQQGDRPAFEAYMGRIAQRNQQHTMAELTREWSVTSQLNDIIGRYPALNDATHPLTQTATQAFQLLVGQGQPNTKATLLEAVKSAIVYRPDLLGGAVSRLTASPTRTAQAGQTGVASRQANAPVNQPAPVTPQQADLARRMGIKDPAKAMERFQARQAAGRSQLGAVAALIPEGSQ